MNQTAESSSVSDIGDDYLSANAGDPDARQPVRSGAGASA